MKQEKGKTPIDQTMLYLENYREMQRYVRDAVSEVDQVGDTDKYNISAEKAYLRSIRECRAETIIWLEHMDKALNSLQEDADATGEGYKYDALAAVSYDRHAGRMPDGDGETELDSSNRTDAERT